MAAWPEHFTYAARSRGYPNGRGPKVLSKHKAQEMLDNPPANQPMTPKQTQYFQAVAHGWKPTHKRR